MNKKLTDEEIIESLENCNRGYDYIRRHGCDTCPYRESCVAKHKWPAALTLFAVKRQKLND